MALAGRAAVAIWNDVEAGAGAAFLDWHNREHLPERVGIAGFLRGRRMRIFGAGTEYFTLYEVADATVLAGPDYLARLNAPTAATQAMMPRMPNAARVLCRVEYSLGAAIGGFAATVRLSRRPEDREREGFEVSARTILDRQAEILGVHLMTRDDDASDRQIVEARLRREAPSVPAGLVMVEGCAAEPVRTAIAVLAAHFTGAGAVEAYGLEICLDRLA